ncbi:MAG: hypothetical protein H0X13_16325 [Ramlibacter sp.]|nr:hypothetical protein [Ramlibacter sp.]
MADSYSLDDVRAMDAGRTSYTLADVRKMAEGPSFNEQMLKRETSDLSANLRRGVRDVLDTGAEWLASTFDGIAGTNEAERVRAMNREAKQEWMDSTGRELLPQVQRVGGNILGTLPATAAIGGGLGALGFQGLGRAVSSGGMTTGVAGGRLADLSLRTAGGGANGYVSAGLVEPDTAGAGGAIGAVTPGVLQSVGAATNAVKRAYTNRGGVGMARDVAELAGANTKEELGRVCDALRQQGPHLIPGAEPTVPQILQQPGLSQLQRTVRAAAPTAFAEREAQQQLARMEALERVAPVSGTLGDTADEVGNAISRYAVPQREAARQGVSAKFGAVDPFNESRVLLPIDQMRAAKDKFLGPGTFGSGGSAQQAIAEAERIGTEVLPGVRQLPQSAGRIPQPVSFDELQNVRSSIGEQWHAATRQGNAKEAAALITQQRAIDDALENLAAGKGAEGEFFAPDMVANYREARAAHAAKKLRFDAGPQAAMFRRGADGELMAQGAEIPRRFFNGRPSQIEDAQAFARLVQNDPQMMGELKRYAVTDAAGKVDRLGNFTSHKFNQWLDRYSGAIGVTFDQQERAVLKGIGESLRQVDLAESLGRGTGSDTAAKLAGLQRLGLMDGPLASIVASQVPYGSQVLGLLQRPARTAKAERLAGLLTDPEGMAGLLDTLITRQPRGLLSQSLSEVVNPALYRGGPLLLTQE